MEGGIAAVVLLYLLAGHALADFCLQNEAMASGKCPHSTHPATHQVPWYYWLAAHALVHGAVVGLVFHMFGAGWTWVTLLFLLESGAHALIDWGKCQGWYGIHIDQGLHLLCKCVWCSLGLGGPALQGGL